MTRNWWPKIEAPDWPPDLSDALAAPMRTLAGCWIEQRCQCGNTRKPLRLIMSEGGHRANMPLLWAVRAFATCPACGEARTLGLASSQSWDHSRPVDKPPNWCLTLTGPEAGAVTLLNG